MIKKSDLKIVTRSVLNGEDSHRVEMSVRHIPTGVTVSGAGKDKHKVGESLFKEITLSVEASIKARRRIYYRATA